MHPLPADPADPAARYVERINRATDHMLGHLGEPLRLDAVAAVAALSPFHFHRLFKAFTGETPNQFVKRQRLARALRLMSHAPRRRLTAVALDCGFASSSDFSRCFRQHFGTAPSAFDVAAFRASRGEVLEGVLRRPSAGSGEFTVQAGTNPDGFTVTLRDLPARTVAYLRVHDPYRPGAVQTASERLLAWADARGLAGGAWLGYLWDEPEIVDVRQCRYDVAVVVDGVEPSGEIGRLEFPAMRVAEVSVSGDLAREARAIDWLYKTWLPASGLEPEDHPVFEAWRGRPYAHGSTHFELACQLPVRRGPP